MSTSQSPPPPTSPGPSEEDKRELEKFLACADPGKYYVIVLFLSNTISYQTHAPAFCSVDKLCIGAQDWLVKDSQFSG